MQTPTVKEGDSVVVWVSCGAASGVALMETIKRYKGFLNIHAVNTPMVEEHEDNQRFLSDLSNFLDFPIHVAVSDQFPDGSAEQVWKKRKFMSSPQGAPCTMFIKKRARQAWENENNPDWHVLGFTADETQRHEKFIKTERENVLPVLVEAGITKDMCYRVLEESGLRLPEMYYLGYPNANCIGCVKSKSITYWNKTRVDFPEIFQQRAELSRDIGCKLAYYKGKRIFLDELPPEAKGYKMKSMPDCGIFCEEWGYDS